MPLNLPNIRDDEVALVAAELLRPEYATLDAAAKAKLLSVRNKVDSGPAPKVFRPLSLSSLQAALSAEGQVWLAGLSPADLEPLLARIRTQDRLGLQEFFALGKEVAAVSALVMAQIDDPTFPSQVLGPNRLSVILGREVGGISEKEVMLIEQQR
jgi:hypothetical protein